MFSKKSHSINILETPFSTVTSGGHWFHATRDTVEQYVPGLLKKHSFESLITKAVVWIDSADSLAMLIYFGLAFVTETWLAAVIAFLFHYWWYHKKSAFVNIVFETPIRILNSELLQVLIAAVVLSYMGISGMYLAVTIGIIYFFLFKVSLLRRLWDKIDSAKEGDKLPLNDRVLKMILVRYAVYEDIPPVEIKKLDDQIRQAVIEFNKKKKK
ncbi:hypothetical protein [Rhodohalobacter barkolensis]|uniref:Uncharacterized protein n=1 Tax=Rhodohalobacter barkolensis TaxID=2053187 RepID=A0A2N0VM17_9BACT|nr:hypothetical protein [Rhodohalobacter barkolensis]PKD45194.1 hypothetical protein CWD77_07025 [Rhodohalobacter barkolensis]